MLPVIDVPRFFTFPRAARQEFVDWLMSEGVDVEEYLVFSVELHEGYIVVGHHPYECEEAWFCRPVRTMPPEEFFRPAPHL